MQPRFCGDLQRVCSPAGPLGFVFVWNLDPEVAVGTRREANEENEDITEISNHLKI